ncbi:tRNA (uridine(34)/cytosine(34)/5-carboxymethylaminomethyluridine(34)-2'-O)-methyltransferase TrmL, partial [Neisseria meningitidis]|uniref:tRNA (cytidine(34)-2'-O)-methyltransferase n=1 Tax=Neisseria meningitidis TaxID=487 RepID=UPI000C6D7D6A
MFTTVLYQLEIPPNTGNIIPLRANTGADLHLAKPLGSPLDSAKMKPAGLDYHEFATLTVHENFDDSLKALAGRRLFALTTKCTAPPSETALHKSDVFMFGPETRGLPPVIPDSLPAAQKI